MRVYWDPAKNEKLEAERDIDLSKVAEAIYREETLDILEHPRREEQLIFILFIYDYVHAAPFVVDENGDVCIKTVYPSRKYQKKYRRKIDA